MRQPGPPQARRSLRGAAVRRCTPDEGRKGLPARDRGDTLSAVHRFELLAPAKVNLTLHVLDRRPDGFHEIVSLFVPLSLADRLEIEVGGPSIEVEVPGHPELEGPENLCTRAARAFADTTGRAVGLRIRLHKSIPVAAGLGGGSSDAAAVLRCLAHLHGLDPEAPEVREAALRVGSDVPFFLRCTPAVARGRGEILEPAPPLPPLYLLLLQPPFGVSAGEAYRSLAALRASGELPMGEAPTLPPAFPDAAAIVRRLHNDLEPAVERLYPIGEVRERFRAAGAQGILMSGSGSCVFALFGSAAEREKCRESLRLVDGETLFQAEALQRPPPLRETRR